MYVEYYSDTNNTIDKFLISKNQPNSEKVDEKTELQQIEYYESQK